MPQLSPSGNQLVQTLADRYGLSADAVTHMLIAVSNGNGTMAQFGHPEFCGSGQWMQGGMTMVSDLFNNNLKCLVNNLCNDIANELARNPSNPFGGSFQSQSQNGVNSQTQTNGQMASQNSLFLPDPDLNWWPAELGIPSSSGSQNNLRYAYFANSCRLAVSTGGGAWVYNTLDHQIGGFAQQQGGGQSITFTSQYGTVDLSSLPIVSRDGQVVTQQPATQQPPQSTQSTNQSGGQSHQTTAPTQQPDTAFAPKPNEDVIETLERLGALKEKGYVTDEEFATKKSELLRKL